jgi:hypothetical protein
LVPPAAAGSTAAEAARIAAIREAIKRAALPLARQVAVTVAPRLLLAAVAVGPAATVIVATAAAVALTLAVIMLAYQIKLIVAEAGIDAPGRTEEIRPAHARRTRTIRSVDASTKRYRVNQVIRKS